MNETSSATEHHDVVIIGAGFAGIGLVIKLREAGITDFLVLERADGVGGTWRDNSYPGCACDVPSHLYSFSFAPNPEWSRTYSRRDEILEYAQGIAARHDVGRDVRFNCAVESAAWVEDTGRWLIQTSTGPLTARVLISALGPFGEPVVPDFPGVETFAGKTMHSFAWDHSHGFDGERVAVIGTGASAVQMIPEAAKEAAHLTVFQRSACWIMPRLDLESTGAERALMRHVPGLRKAMRLLQYGAYESYGSINFLDRRFARAFEAIAKAQLKAQVKDPETRRKLTPNYRLGCKRTAVSATYLPSFNRSNVQLATDPIAYITPTGLVTAEGTEHEVDTIVFGTGFTLMHHLTQEIIGRNGRSIAEVYNDRPQSYLGVSMAGFPNLFLTSGPFGGAGNQSFLYMLEAQFAYIVDALTAMDRNDWAVVDVLPEVQDAFVDDAERRSADSIWLNGGCSGYYTTADGKRNAGIWPDWSFNYRRKTKHFVAANYEVQVAADIATATAEAN